MQNPNITFNDSDYLTIVYSSLVINVESINKKYGVLYDFLNEFNLGGETNGKLFITAQMMDPPDELINIINKTLKPLGFEEKKDYLLCYEYLVEGVRGSISPLLNKEIPECMDVDWLGSVIRLNGNFVWHKPANSYNSSLKWGINSAKDDTMEIFQGLLINYFKKINPYKLLYNPKVLELKKGIVIFKFTDKETTSSFSVHHLLEYTYFKK